LLFLIFQLLMQYCVKQLIDDKGYDGAEVDLWCCGIILYVFMAGYLPFNEANLMTLYKKV
jgi:5'-AMP-activated protein kinase catalytic alpha subunit